MSDMIERMAHMWNVEGLSQSQIGRQFDITVQAVAGLIYRNRDKFKRRNQNASNWRDVKRGRVQKTSDKPLQTMVTASQKANQRRQAFHAVKVAEQAKAAPVTPVEPEIDGKEYDAARLPMAKDLLALGSCDCKWPLNEGGPFLFCCAEVVTGSVYCRHHRARSKGKGTESERKATDALKRAA